MEKIESILIRFLKWFIFLSFSFGFYYFFINTVNYFDPINHCYINITTDPLNGNRKTIQSALKLLRASDAGTYAQVCDNVDSIEERYCDLRTLMSSESTPWHKAEGCFVKGGKSIYLKPNESSSMTTRRAESIKKYSQMSEEFWERK